MLLAPDVAPPPAIIRAHCPAGQAHARCGFVRVPLDHQNPTARTIQVYFEHYLRQDRRDPAAATVVAIEGGPGYATTGSRDSYLALWRPVSQHRDLLLADLRGTGPTARRSPWRTSAACCRRSGPARWICTATPTAPTPPRRSPCATRTDCARWCWTAPIRSRAPTRPSPTSPCAPGRRCGWPAAAGRTARSAIRFPSCARWCDPCAPTRSSATPLTATAPG